jgi:transcriptional antiterminator RfaH
LAEPRALREVVTPDSESPHESSPSRQWFAIQTRYRCERAVASRLADKGIETFLPLLEETHRWTDRQKKILVPLFSGYAFVQLDNATQSRKKVLGTYGVLRFVEFGGDVAPVPPVQIQHLRTLLQQKVPCALHPFLKTGQKVRVRGGCLDGLEGVLHKNGDDTVVISIDLIERSLALSLKGYELELI